jgi:hypothetical protein
MTRHCFCSQFEGESSGSGILILQSLQAFTVSDYRAQNADARRYKTAPFLN